MLFIDRSYKNRFTACLCGVNNMLYRKRIFTTFFRFVKTTIYLDSWLRYRAYSHLDRKIRENKHYMAC